MQSEALTEDGVELWLAPVAATYDAAQLAAYETLLSVDEQARWRRFHRAVDRQRFLVGRAFMRCVLADRLGQRDPAALQFTQQLHGKPVLGGADGGKLHFNLSHTDDMLVLALSRRHCVGVDVEAITRKVELLALAERYFAAHEYAELRVLDDTAQRERFFRLWTLKEAWLKARGLGLRVPLDNFSFTADSACPAIEFSPQLQEHAGEWQFRTFARDRFRIALAVQCAAPTPLQIVLHEWTGMAA